MRIENWAVVVSDPYAAPEARRQKLQGEVFGHPRFPDGTTVTTSSIVGKNWKGHVTTSSGSYYELGQVDPAYEEQFPGARDRLLDSL